MCFVVTADIAAAPERAWAVMLDLERWPEWTASVRSIERLDSAPLRLGSRVRIRQPKLLPAVWTVTSLTPNRSFTWLTRRPGLSVSGEHSVGAIEHGSRVTLSLEFGGVLGPLLARLTRTLSTHYLNLEVSGLKRRCEA